MAKHKKNADIFRHRQQKVAKFLLSFSHEATALAIFIDIEGQRDNSLRYLCNHPGDAILAIDSSGKSVLLAWDFHLASSRASADLILPYTNYNRQLTSGLAAILQILSIRKNSHIELPLHISYNDYKEITTLLPDFIFHCDGRSSYNNDENPRTVYNGVHNCVYNCRAIKDAGEQAIYKHAAKISNNIVLNVIDAIRKGKLRSELDIALYLDSASKLQNCEDLGFKTLVAGSKRSWAIHPYPGYCRSRFGTKGLSLIDFGIVWQGYTTDVTVSILKGGLSKKQKAIVDLVRIAYEVALSMCKPGMSCRAIASRIDEIFATGTLGYSFVMPHGLGHGIGLDIHELPFIRNRDNCTYILQPGNIITIEPGLYDPELGGVRIENSVLITTKGREVLTNAQIVHF